MIERFSKVPQVYYNRSMQDLSHSVDTSMRVGQLVPIDCVEVLPGDTFKVNTKALARIVSGVKTPFMGDLFLDVYSFFVPYRLVYDDAEKIFGDSSPSQYVIDNLKKVPSTNSTVSQTVVKGSLADYLGIPIGVVPNGLNLFPFRSYAKIYNDWFRNENVSDEVYIQKGLGNVSEYINANAFSPNNYMGMPAYVNKKKDYFTSCLPKTQKSGNPVSLPLGTFAPVVTENGNHSVGINPITIGGSGMSGYHNILANFGSSPLGYGTLGVDSNVQSGVGVFGPLMTTNLVTDLSQATSATVNDLRFAFQLQKMLEKDALYGSRYNEYLLAHFGVNNPDARLQRSEYLGGCRIPINVQTVAQTSKTDSSDYLGKLGGFSQSFGQGYFSKGFTEHGLFMTVACIRQFHTYSQGLPRMFTRRDRNDFYDPLFANLGEQAVYTSELYLLGQAIRGNVFGYQEAWAEYRYCPNKVTGAMRPTVGNVGATWSIADNYANAPTLSASFTNETGVNVDRILNVNETLEHPFILDFWFDFKAIRVMPQYSRPGLIDHH